MRVAISIAEPWELSDRTSEPMAAELSQTWDNEQGGRALIKLDKPIDYRGEPWRYLIVEARHAGDRIFPLSVGATILGSFIGISDQQAASPSPFDTSSWRGGLAFIGDIQAVSA